MKKLEYIGLKKDGERHMQAQTGVEWMPGAVHEVSDEHAAELLKHTDVWREVSAKALKLASVPAPSPAPTPAPASVQLPDWAKKGVELGATDDQLEAVAKAGGPTTEEGAALWKDATGTDWKPEEKAATKKTTPAKKAPAKQAAKATGGKAKRS